MSLVKKAWANLLPSFKGSKLDLNEVIAVFETIENGKKYLEKFGKWAGEQDGLIEDAKKVLESGVASISIGALTNPLLGLFFGGLVLACKLKSKQAEASKQDLLETVLKRLLSGQEELGEQIATGYHQDRLDFQVMRDSLARIERGLKFHSVTALAGQVQSTVLIDVGLFENLEALTAAGFQRIEDRLIEESRRNEERHVEIKALHELEAQRREKDAEHKARQEYEQKLQAVRDELNAAYKQSLSDPKNAQNHAQILDEKMKLQAALQENQERMTTVIRERDAVYVEMGRHQAEIRRLVAERQQNSSEAAEAVADGLFLRAIDLAREGRLEEVPDFWEKAYQDHPEARNAIDFAQDEFWFMVGDWEKAANALSCIQPKPEEEVRLADFLSSIVPETFKWVRYAVGIVCGERALEIRQRVLGERHPDTITSMNNLAGLYYATGRYGDAEPLYEKALDLSREVLGEKHPNTIRSMNNLGALYSATGRYGDAEPLYRDALALRREVLGEKHPDTITSMSMNNLAGLYSATGRYGDAEPLHRDALALRREVLGEKHPDTIQSMNNLSKLYDDTGRYGEAEPLLEKALDLCREVLGEKHPDTILSMNNLATFWINQGNPEGRPLLCEAFRLSRNLPHTHPARLGIERSVTHLQLDCGE